jgi:PPM family protein phosphatase
VAAHRCRDIARALAWRRGAAYRARVRLRSRAGRHISGAATDVGRVRDHNEDTYLLRPDLGLYLVADGMGGHQAGDIASAMVRLSVANFFEVTQREDFSGPPRSQSRGEMATDYIEPGDEAFDPPGTRLRAAIRKANHDVFSASADNAVHYGMGSTVVAAHLPNESSRMYIAHVGDSRCYRIRGKHLELLTRDHSLINEALALDPSMSPEDLARLPTNIITRALGMDASVEVDLTHADVKTGDTYLLCSDGLSGLIRDEEILEAIALVEDASEVCDLLVALANEAGGVDNITALALKV